MNRNTDMVSASEIGSYGFCPDAWRLGDALGLRSGNEQQLQRGEATHAKTVKVDRRSHMASQVGLVLLMLAVLALVVSGLMAVGQ